MGFIRRARKGLKVIHRFYIQKTHYVMGSASYMRRYIKFLRKNGMDIPEMPNYIHNDVHFDGKDYSIIHLGKNCTISTGVYFLTHDYSMHTIFNGEEFLSRIEHPEYFQEWDKKDKMLVLKGIHIGDNTFIGARATLLPGTHIGNNSIVGAGAVVKGIYPDESIIIGNPARVVGKTSEWLNQKTLKALEEIKND